MTQILVTGALHSFNKGWSAIIRSTVNALRSQIPNARFVLESYFPEIDSNRYDDLKVTKTIIASPLKATFILLRCIIWKTLHTYFHLNINKIIDIDELQSYTKSDIIVDVCGDVLAVPFRITNFKFALKRNFADFILHSYLLLFGILLQKPVVLCAQSFGSNNLMVPLLRFVLNRASLITVREKLSEEYLRRIGVNKPPVYLTADMAFALQPAKQEEVREVLFSKIGTKKGPLVGIAVSRESAKYYFKLGERHFIKLMAKVVDYLTRLNNTIIFIPYSLGPRDFEDDRTIAKEICEMVRDKDKVKIIVGDYDPSQLKGIVMQCDMFIGMRMHSNIAALSSFVPTIAIAHSHKTYGIMAMLGQERWICDIRRFGFKKLISKVNDLQKMKEEIREELKVRIPAVQGLALSNASLIAHSIFSKEKLWVRQWDMDYSHEA